MGVSESPEPDVPGIVLTDDVRRTSVKRTFDARFPLEDGAR